jgi:hypothetical protein
LKVTIDVPDDLVQQLVQAHFEAMAGPSVQTTPDESAEKPTEALKRIPANKLPCTEADCDELQNAKGFCKRHIAARYRAKNAENGVTRARPICDVADCETAVNQGGLCWAHFRNGRDYIKSKPVVQKKPEPEPQPVGPSPELQARMDEIKAAEINRLRRLNGLAPT